MCEVEGTLLAPSDMGKCLYRSLVEGLEREHQEGNRVFPPGDLPRQSLSNRSVVETCVLPVPIYECENWILNS